MAGRVRVTAEQATAKWLQRLSASGAEITAGVNRVTVAPGRQAAEKRAKWIAGIQASQDKWARNVASVSLEEWKKSMLDIGVQRVAQGAQAKQHKTHDFMSHFIPFLDTGLQRIHALPDTTPEERINRMVAMVRYTAGYKRPTSG